MEKRIKRKDFYQSVKRKIQQELLRELAEYVEKLLKEDGVL